VQRLFSVFPEGWPGAGLVLLRAVATVPLLQFIESAGAPLSMPLIAVHLLEAICSSLLIIGLWTPISAGVISISEIALLFFPGSDFSMHIVTATIGAAIAMIGPGAWSVDARLFGRKRIRIPSR
jgi:putative oxidoreductase